MFLRHGSHVEVLDPQWLREKVVGELCAAVKFIKGCNIKFDVEELWISV
jgi:hypothetical protein